MYHDSASENRPIVRVGKVPFTVTDADAATASVIRWSETHTPVSVRLSNAYCVSVASKDSEYAEILAGPGHNFPDGRPVVWAMNALSGKGVTAGHVRGPSLFRNVLDHGRAADLKHYFLGATEETLKLLTNAATSEYPGLVVAGAYSPPFGPVDSAFLNEVSERIKDSDADIVWVALGTPKQDFCTSELCNRVKLPCVGVGAAFDFVAGTMPEAPHLFQRLGIEWIYRLFSEPRRLWKRYLFGNLTFIRSAVLESRS